MGWQLLTGPYKLPKEKLYVTYFGGSDQVLLILDSLSLLSSHMFMSNVT